MSGTTQRYTTHTDTEYGMPVWIVTDTTTGKVSTWVAQEEAQKYVNTCLTYRRIEATGGQAYTRWD